MASPIFDAFRLDGKVALVTGGLRGIGLGISHALGEAGARLIVASRSPHPAALAALRERGFAVDFVEADLGDPAAPAKMVAEAVRIGGRLDILVNNAGIALGGDTTSYSLENYRKLMAINLDAVFLACQAALKPMRAQKGGVILNIGSISGLVSNIPQQQTAYNAAKAAVHMLTKSLASDYAADNIRVNAIAPGYILTDMIEGGLADPALARVWTGMTPLGRPGRIDEVASGALYLCSPASSYVTGEVLVIDGGYTLR